MQSRSPDKPTLKLHFRLGEADDVDALHELIERAYRGPETAGRWDSESHLLKGPRTTSAYIAEQIASPTARFVVAEHDGQLAGCAHIEQRPGPDSDHRAYFGMFAISPDHRGLGLGDAVLAEAEASARRIWNADTLVLTVISVRTELIAWYERRGYRKTGVAHPFPFSETTGELRRDFDLVELSKRLS